MINKLNRRSTAWMITALAILLFVWAGSGRSLMAARNDVEGRMYEDLDQLAANSINLTVVAERYMSAEDAAVVTLKQQAEKLRDSDSMRAKSLTTAELQNSVDALVKKLEQQQLSDADVQLCNKLTVNIDAAYKIIDSSGYNQRAEEFNAQLDKMPTKLLADISGVKKLEQYS